MFWWKVGLEGRRPAGEGEKVGWYVVQWLFGKGLSSLFGCIEDATNVRLNDGAAAGWE